MVKALLLDLDGTLLENSMDIFVPAYLKALGAFLKDHIKPERLVAELLRATQVMAANDGGGATNEEVFAAAFYPAIGKDRASFEPVIRRFYAEEFPKLRALTRPAPEARTLVSWAFERGLQVAVATNPLFPRTAIEQRLQWAGVGVDDFPYALVTTYEIMRASKQNDAYYREILEGLGRAPEDCFMVGDDWAWDILPTTRMGMDAWWISDPAPEPPSPIPKLIGCGSLADLWERIRSKKSPFH
jgi:FMN phosphatase YigB (HAD superfamily)